MTPQLQIGTCSWKFEAWRGIVYSDSPRDMLAEYSQRYGCVEIDQWYWSLFGADKVALPQPKIVTQYAQSVPAGFRFGVKLPDALTLTHLRPSDRAAALVPNPHFLSPELLLRFMERLEPMRGLLGPLMLQFGYLNREMTASQSEFLERLDGFVKCLPSGHIWAVEIRNPNWLNRGYFSFLRERGLAHVFEQGYYMPAVADVYAKHADLLTGDVVVRMHGRDYEAMGKRQGKDWSKIVEPRDADLDRIAAMLKDIGARGKQAWAFVNNHFEGCAPKTIDRIRERMGR